MAKKFKPLLIVISGCSGVGKDTVLDEMKRSDLPFFFAITATTRTQRPGEIDGIDYHFVTLVKFEKMIEKDELLEWANVYHNWYGVPKKPVKNALKEGKDVIIKVDIQGATTIKQMEPEAVLIFISPPSMEDLRQRLITRNTESASDLEVRLRTAQKEMESLPLFDYEVINATGEMERTIAQIQALIKDHKSGLTERKGHKE